MVRPLDAGCLVRVTDVYQFQHWPTAIRIWGKCTTLSRLDHEVSGLVRNQVFVVFLLVQEGIGVFANRFTSVGRFLMLYLLVVA